MLQKVRGGYRGLQGVTGIDKGLQGVTGGYGGLQKGYLTIIPRGHVGYEMIDSQRGA